MNEDAENFNFIWIKRKTKSQDLLDLAPEQMQSAHMYAAKGSGPTILGSFKVQFKVYLDENNQ